PPPPEAAVRGPGARGFRRARDARLLPALRRRDGADAALPRHPLTRRGRLRERPVRRQEPRVGRLRPGRPYVGRGLVARVGVAAACARDRGAGGPSPTGPAICGSRSGPAAGAGSGSTRPPAAAAWPAVT